MSPTIGTTTGIQGSSRREPAVLETKQYGAEDMRHQKTDRVQAGTGLSIQNSTGFKHDSLFNPSGTQASGSSEESGNDS